MMRSLKLMNILSVLVLCLTQHLPAQNTDSLMTDRQVKFDEYSQFKDQMSERTWINLVELGKKADKVLDADNALLQSYFEEELAQNRSLVVRNEELMLEIAGLRNDYEKRNTRLHDYRQMNNTLLLIILGLSILFIASIIILVNQYRKNKQITFELQRFWSMNDDQSVLIREKAKDLEKQIHLLEIENKAMHKEFIHISDQKIAAKKRLEAEIQSRRKVEQEIKDLLLQLKGQ